MNDNKILNKIIEIPEIKKIMKLKNITAEMIQRDINLVDQISMLENHGLDKEINSHLYVIDIDRYNKVFCKWEINSKFWQTETLSIIKPNYFYHSFPPKFLELTKNDIKPNKDATVLLKALNTWVNKTPEDSSTNFLLIKGPNHIGKSFMATIFLNRASKKGYQVSQIYLPDFFTYLKSLMNKKSAYENNSNSMELLLKGLKEVDYLLIDGLGEESSSQWTISDILLPLISYRKDANAPTAITTTSSISEIKVQYLKTGSNKKSVEKLISILRKDFKLIEIKKG